jgi:hypothetical protein
MHIEVLVEDSSGQKLLELLIPQLVGQHGDPHTWRLIPYKGIGRIPVGLVTNADPAKRILLEQLPKLLRGYRKTPGIDLILVVLDADKRDCTKFLHELKETAKVCDSEKIALFRLAIEEIEAWYLGDREALLAAYPRAKQNVLDQYKQDSACGTWELLADMVYPGGSVALKRTGWPLPGQVKHEWAEKIGPHMVPDRNVSPSFGKLRDALRRVAKRGTDTTGEPLSICGQD